MINNWFSPIDFKQFQKFKNYQFGKKILLHSEKIPDLTDVQIAIIGAEEVEANAIRQVLYTNSFPFKKLKVADLGNARKTDASFLTPIIKELLESHIFPIIIGQSENTTLAQYHAYASKKQLVNMVIVDEKINYVNPRNKATTYLNQIIDSRSTHLFNLGMIGYQAHFTPPEIVRAFERKNFETIRLGKVRSNLDEIEPIVRDADMLVFNLGAIRHTEFPGVPHPTPSGFFTEEACKISRYAGLSEKLTSVGFYGFDARKDIRQQSAHIVAQLVWYFIDGFYHRKNDYPVSTTGLVEYIVDSKKNDYQITFWKSEKTGRWWMQVPLKTSRKLKRHKLIPCSYSDYQMTCRDDLPERLLNAFRRFA